MTEFFLQLLLYSFFFVQCKLIEDFLLIIKNSLESGSHKEFVSYNKIDKLLKYLNIQIRDFNLYIVKKNYMKMSKLYCKC